jgi:hypothetical protein
MLTYADLEIEGGEPVVDAEGARKQLHTRIPHIRRPEVQMRQLHSVVFFFSSTAVNVY